MINTNTKILIWNEDNYTETFAAKIAVSRIIGTIAENEKNVFRKAFRSWQSSGKYQRKKIFNFFSSYTNRINHIYSNPKHFCSIMNERNSILYKIEKVQEINAKSIHILRNI